jgi:protein tyrosine/serine phosphatase
MSFFSVLFLLPAMLTSEQPFPKHISSKFIPRFQMVDAGIYRGGQPIREGFELLKRHGIKTVINLRTENDEAAIVKELGMNYIHLPINLKMWSKIPDKAIQRYFEIVNDPANHPIFFHCRRGADRTGALAGFYRIAVQGWGAEKAYKEARDIGMRWWYPAVKDQMYEFSRDYTAYLKPATVPASR